MKSLKQVLGSAENKNVVNLEVCTILSKLWRGMCDSANSMGWNKVEGGSGLLLVAAKGLEQV
jgi:hypothetical protein